MAIFGFSLGSGDIMFITQAFMGIGFMISFGVLVLNFKQNWNFLKLKFIPNSGIIRFKTPSRREEEIVVRFNDKVIRRKVGDKNLAHLIDPNKIYFKALNMLGLKQLDEKPSDDSNPTIKQLLMAQVNNLTFMGKIPVLEYKADSAEPIDPYEKETMISAELLEGMLVGAEATADLDFFKRLFGYKHIWQFAAAIAIGSCAAAFFGWQILTALNSNPYFLGELPVCQIAAETGKIIVAGG